MGCIVAVEMETVFGTGCTAAVVDIVAAAAVPVVAEVATTVASAVPGLEVPDEIVEVDELSAIFESAVTVIVHTNGFRSAVPTAVPLVVVAV